MALDSVNTSTNIPANSAQKTSRTESKASSEDPKLKQACKDFESIFLGFIMKSMRKTVQQNELMGSSDQEKMFQDMMDDEVCKSASETSSVGIADVLYNQLSAQFKLQGTAMPETSRGTN
ncbi:MAG: rod-binding protein [Armatimonadota bacterium]|nr:rod-binding protein [bacterium]